MFSLHDKLTLTVIGRSGCGKGTQAKFLAKRLRKDGVRRLETGRFLRQVLKKQNPTTEKAVILMKEGGLFPFWFAAYTWLKDIIEKGAAAQNMIFDGAPRRVWEAELLDEVIKWHKRPLPVCIYIDVFREEAYKRLILRQRVDDNSEAINNRLDFFETDVTPVVKYYEDAGRLLFVNGNQSVRKVWEEIDKKLAERLGGSWPREMNGIYNIDSGLNPE